MEAIDRFFEWYRKLNGNVPEHYREVLENRYFEPLLISSFKERAEEVKKNYNYKFRMRSRFDDFLSNEPNIETIIFEKK